MDWNTLNKQAKEGTSVISQPSTTQSRWDILNASAKVSVKETGKRVPPYTPPPVFGGEGKIGKGLDYISNWLKSVETFREHPIQTFKEAGKEAIQVPIQAGKGLLEKGQEIVTQAKTGQGTVIERLANVLKYGGNTAHVAFSPIIMAFTVAEKLPFLQPAADIISLPFILTGKLGVFAADKFIDVLPMSQENKDILRPALEEVSALTGQIVLGGKIIKAISQRKKIDKKVIDDAVKETKAETAKVAEPKAVIPEVKLAPEIAPKPLEAIKEAIPVEKAIIPQELKIGKKILGVGTNKERIPITYKDGGLELLVKKDNKSIYIESVGVEKKGIGTGTEMINQTIDFVKREYPNREIRIIPSTQQNIDFFKKFGFEERIIDIKGTKEMYLPQALKGVKEVKPEVIGKKPSKIAKSIEAKSIEAGLTKGFKDLAGYDPITIKDQAKRMSDIMATDIERAKRIATGKEELPTGLKGAAAIKAMEDYAMEMKDGKLARDLAKSPLVSETSEAGQTLRLAAERTPDSAVMKIREVMKEREKAFEKKARGVAPEKIKSNLKKELENKVKQSKPNRYSWEKLLEELICA